MAELALAPEEGEQFLKAAQNVMRHYNVQTTQKAMDWIAFAGCAGMIYVPRLVAISMNRKTSKPAATVTPLRAVNGTAPSTASPQQSHNSMSPMEAAFNANMVIPDVEN